MHVTFFAVSFNRTQDLYFPKNSRKIVTTAPSIKLDQEKLYQCHCFKRVYCMQNFVRFQAIKSESELS